jgi:hypothetical protein
MTVVTVCRTKYRYRRWTKGKGLFGQVVRKLLKKQRPVPQRIQFYKLQEFLFFACIQIREPALSRSVVGMEGLRTLSTYAQYQTTNTALETRVYTIGYLFSSYGAQKTTYTTMSAIITSWLS